MHHVFEVSIDVLNIDPMMGLDDCLRRCNGGQEGHGGSIGGAQL
jgi:hypothetical protein